MAQHMEDYTNQSKESQIRRHLEESHPGQDPLEAFQASVITPHTSALACQVQEAWLIKTYRGEAPYSTPNLNTILVLYQLLQPPI